MQVTKYIVHNDDNTGTNQESSAMNKLPFNEHFGYLRQIYMHRFEDQTEEDKLNSSEQTFSDRDEEIYENLQAYSCMGLYQISLSLFRCCEPSEKTDKYLVHLIEAILATEKYHLYPLTTEPATSNGTEQFYYRAILCNEAQNCYGYDIHISCLMVHLMDVLGNRYYDGDINKNHIKIVLGYLNIFCAEIFDKFLASNTKQDQVKICDISTHKRMGYAQIAEGFAYRNNLSSTMRANVIISYNEQIDDYLFDKRELYMFAKVFVEQKRYNEAIERFILCIVHVPELLLRSLCFRDLSNVCYMNGMYQLSMKTLRCCYNICNGYFLPSFVNQEYFTRKQLVKKKQDSLKCANCGKCSICNKCCIGCMVVFYCNRKCQKRHWKSTHSLFCTKYYQTLYTDLRSVVDVFKCYDMNFVKQIYKSMK